MKNSVNRSRIFCFTIPALMDGIIGLVQTSLPLLALRLAADAWFLGMLGWLPQGVRFFFSLSSGYLSDKFGRLRVIIPSVTLIGLMSIGLAFIQNRWQILPLYVMLLAGFGAFYPALQAFIGDRSPKGELRKNLTAFNIGWTVGGSICAAGAGYLLYINKSAPFLIVSVLAIAIIIIVTLWSRYPNQKPDHAEITTIQSESGYDLLLISRISHFMAFFGYALIRNIFPKLGIDLGMSEGVVGLVGGMVLAGEPIGMLICGIGPWWRGKVYPILLSQVLLFIAFGIAVFANSPFVFGLAFFIYGAALGVAYSQALYYGLEARSNMGKNGGIHEGLIAAAIVLASLMGGYVGQKISIRFAFEIFVIIMFVMIIVSCLLAWLSLRKMSRNQSTINNNSSG